MMTAVTAPVRKSLDVACAIERAFEVFTAGIDAWWPRADYSIFGARAAKVVFETHVGGRIYEIRDDGEEGVWGEVLVFEPVVRLVYSWHPAGDPARATEVEVRFTPLDDGTTRVEIEHRYWERLGDKAAASRAGYDGGWTEVMAAYARAAAA